MGKIYLLGTGTPTPTPTRFGSSHVIEVGGEYLMFDCGPATCLANHLRSMSATLDLAKYTQAGIGRLRRLGRSPRNRGSIVWPIALILRRAA